MSDHLRENAQPCDREAITAVIESIKAFFTRGRRTDLNRNVFYAAAAAVIPKGVRENKQIRAVMRLAGLRHDAISKGVEFRNEMDDHKCGWKPLGTAKHSDAVDYAPLDSWFHSSAASTEDNEVKNEVRVGMVEDGGSISYQLHNRRYLNAKIPILHKDFEESPELEQMKLKYAQVERQKRRKKALAQLKRELDREAAEAEVTAKVGQLGDEYQKRHAKALAKKAKRKVTSEDQVLSEADVEAQMGNALRLPELVVSLGTFRKKKCECLVYRKGGDCDCTLCMYILVNLRKLKIDMQRWHSVESHGCSLECNDKTSAFSRSLADINSLQQFIFCERIEVPELTCSCSARLFKVFKRACVVGTCCSLDLSGGGGELLAKRKCGLEVKAPKCALLWCDEPHMWFRYEPTQVGTNKETKEPIMSAEFRPVFGTRLEFITDYTARLEQYAPHKQDDRIQRNNLTLSMEQIMAEKDNPTVGMKNSDYAAQFEVVRWTTPTCGIKSSHNNCVMMFSCKPTSVKKYIRKWGKREASVEDTTRNYCVVVYGIFSNRNKPSAHHYNMQFEDLLHFMKFGFTIHGEWFIRGFRVLRKRRGVASEDALPEEPGADGERNAVNGTRVLIWSEEQKGFFSGSVSYDKGFIKEQAKEGKSVDKDDNGSPLHYLVKCDDGDEGHLAWRGIQVGMRNASSGGFIDVAHKLELPSGALNTDTGKVWTLRDATVQDLDGISVPAFPEMEDVIQDTDGCGNQFQGQTNAGRVARSASSAVRVRRKGVISIAGHGKNHSDHQGYTMDRDLKELALSSEAPVLSGSRSAVLALAQHRPEPTQTHESKHSPWAPKDAVYAFYEDKLLDRSHEQFAAYTDSKYYHSRTGMQQDARTAETLGTLSLNRIHCACDSCKAPKYDFQNCPVRHVVGPPTKKECKRVRGAAAVTTQTQALADFSLKVRKGDTWPLRVEEDQEGEEGRFWLAMVDENPERLEESITFGRQVFQEGWIVVKARYYSFFRVRELAAATRVRVYKLLKDPTYLSLNHLVRLEKPLNIS